MLITVERLKELLAYSPASGRFHWRVNRGPRTPDSLAGCIHVHNKYRYLLVDGKTYREHRLVWLYMTGQWPDKDKVIDHKNRDKTDNRWENLRLATISQNHANAAIRPKNKSGFKGVYLNAGKWAATIGVNGKVRNLGRYETKEEAHAAYCRAAEAAFGEFARFK